MNTRRIGFLTGEGPFDTAFRDELRRLGYVDGENFVLEARVFRGNTLSDVAAQTAELAHMDLELIVAVALLVALEVRKANPAMPMVIATCPGMISNGFATSLGHPGGNVTGIDELPPGVTAKRLTLLKTAAPRASRIALLSTTPGHGGHEAQVADAEQAAVALGVSVKTYRVTSFSELEPALAAMVDDRMDGLVNFQGGLSVVNRKLIVISRPTTACPQSIKPRCSPTREGCWLGRPISTSSSGWRQVTWIKSSKAQNRATCRSSTRLGIISPSTAPPRRISGWRFRQLFSRKQTGSFLKRRPYSLRLKRGEYPKTPQSSRAAHQADPSDKRWTANTRHRDVRHILPQLHL